MSLNGGTILYPPYPFIIPPHTDTEVTVLYCNTAAAPDTLLFTTTSDLKPVQTIVDLTPVRISYSLTGKLHFGPICVSSSDSSVITLTRNDGDSLTFDSVFAPSTALYTISSKALAKDSLVMTVQYAPQIPGTNVDTITIFARSGKCDSVIRVALTGVATASAAVLSASRLHFGSLDTGKCVDDSIRISLPCGNGELIHLTAHAPFSIVSPADGSISLTNGSSELVVFRYCPTSVGSDSESISFLNAGGDSVIILLGSATAVPAKPYIHFSLQKLQVAANSKFRYTISIDSIHDLDSIQSVSGVLTYNPAVVMPVGSPTGVAWVISGSENPPGQFKFSASGVSKLSVGDFAYLSMQPFYSQSNSTSIFLTNATSIGTATIASDTGFISLTDCSNLPGNIIIAGPYSIDKVYANPVSSSYKTDITLGAEGVLSVKIYNVTGSVALEKIFDDLARGKHQLDLDVSALPSGVYHLSLESMGWHAGNSFIIQR
jgi:hypothetical protein